MGSQRAATCRQAPNAEKTLIRNIVTTPIAYYGGKLSIVRHLLPMVPEHQVYTENFAGGLTLLFAKEPVKNETINDKNDVVVNFYLVLKNDFQKLNKLIDQSLCSRSMNRYGNDLIRSRDRGENVNKIELAWAFWYTTNFNYARKLGATYSYSQYKSTPTPDTLQNKKREFTEQLVRRIEHCYIENEDYLKVLRSRNVHDAFHYLDPPYFFGKAGLADHGHYRKAFTIDNYVQMLEWCASECKGKFLLSNYNSEVLEQFILKYGWFKREITHRLSAPRKSGTAKVELLVSNYDTPCGTLKLF